MHHQKDINQLFQRLERQLDKASRVAVFPLEPGYTLGGGSTKDEILEFARESINELITSICVYKDLTELAALDDIEKRLWVVKSRIDSLLSTSISEYQAIAGAERCKKEIVDIHQLFHDLSA